MPFGRGDHHGPIISCSDNRMLLASNSDLHLNRSGLTEVPASFVPEIILQYDPSSYSEIIL